MKNKVLAYIEENWESTIKENREDNGFTIGLPYPYTVPAVGHFDALFYWDTYFANIGLLLSGRQKQAKYNVDNMLYLVERYGYMPNANQTYFLGGSQPPFLCEMVRDVYEYFKDKVWLLGAYNTLKKEYKFWMTERCTSLGLNKYGRPDLRKDYITSAREYTERIGFVPPLTTEEIERQYAAVGESGWDVTPRWGQDAFNFVSVDLNSLLYLFEKNMAYFSRELTAGEETVWEERAEKRKDLMFRYLDKGDGLLEDYNVVDKRHSDVLSAAIFFPLYASLAEKKHAEAVLKVLDRLEAPYGILTCEKNDAKGVYQWNYPNGWACLQYIAICGLRRYGYTEEAKRIAANYIKLTEKVFAETGNLWEKYNVIEGNINVSNEYKMPAMMGWTAGVYLGARHFLDQ